MSLEPFITTSIAGTFLPRLRRTHERRRISVFAGPPGIGKTTAIRAFLSEEDFCAAAIVVPPGPKGGLRPVAAMALAIEALGGLVEPHHADRVPTGYVELRNRLYSLVCHWAGMQPGEVRRDQLDAGQFPPLTLIFDEAQNLSREAIEVLRFLNDVGGGFSPLPLGLAFVGNNEFVLKSDGRGQSVLSAAVSDRALYSLDFSYRDVTDDDLALFFEAQGIVDPTALGLIIRHFGGRPDRSFRRAGDLAAELRDEANGSEVDAEVVRRTL